MKQPFLYIGMALVFLTTNNAIAAEPADIIYYDGHILTINDDQPTAEAVAVKNGKILSVGPEAEVSETMGEDTQKIDKPAILAMILAISNTTLMGR